LTTSSIISGSLIIPSIISDCIHQKAIFPGVVGYSAVFAMVWAWTLQGLLSLCKAVWTEISIVSSID
jgi:hypothetical protein